MARSREGHKPVERPPAGGAQPGPGRLVVLSGADRGRELRLDRSVLTVGRDPSCDLVLGDRQVSGRHARLEVGAAGVLLVDRGSTNGTWRAGRRVSTPVELRPGEVVAFGEVEVRYDAGYEPSKGEAGGDAETGAGTQTGAQATLPAVARATGAVDPFEAPAAPLEMVPTARPRTVLVSYDPVDRRTADLLVEGLQRAGHLVWIDRSTSGDGWGGRLLDTMWSCDAVVFVVSPAAAHSERVRREVHLAGAERTPVLPVVAAPVDLPPELAFYLARRRPVELWTDPVAGLRRLVDEVGAVPRKRVARPRRLFGLLVTLVLVAVLVLAGVRYLLG